MPRGKIEGRGVLTQAKDAKDHDRFLVEQFARNFQTLLRQTTEKRGTGVVDRFDADHDQQAEVDQVAFYGAIGQKLVRLIHKMMYATDEMATSKKEELLLEFGDKLMEIHEYKAAQSFFYDTVLSARKDGEDPASEGFVRALYGAAVCRIRVLRREDCVVAMPGTLEKMIYAMQLVQRGMTIAVKLEKQSPHQCAWLILNGTVHVMSIARPLKILGFDREVVTYLKWCILAMESTVTLCTFKYLLWRVQLYSTIAECYEAIAIKRPKKAPKHLQSALKCAEAALAGVKRLRREEELDPPIPQHVAMVLWQAETATNVLVARIRAAAKGENVTDRLIESTSDDPDTRLRFALEAISSINALDTTDNMLSHLSSLITYVLEKLNSVLAPLAESTDPSDDDVNALEVHLSLSAHVMLLRRCVQLKRLEDSEALVKAAKTRVIKSRDTQSGRDANTLFDLYTAVMLLDSPPSKEELSLDESSAASISTNSVVLHQTVAAALKLVVSGCSEAIVLAERDFLISIAIRLWNEAGLVSVKELDAIEFESSNRLSIVSAISVLHAVHLTFIVTQFDDMVLLGEVTTRLCILLKVERRLRQAIEVARRTLTQINQFRDQVTDVSKHFNAPTFERSLAFGSATFSFEIEPENALSDCPSDNDHRSRVGVQGTGSQFGGLHQEVACIQTDLLLLLFELELEEATVVNTIGSSSTSAVSMIKTVLSSLQREYKKNGYAAALLGIQQLRQTPPEMSTEREMVVEECFKSLQRAESREQELIKSLRLSTATAQESTVPRAPRVVSRCSTMVTLQLRDYLPSAPAARKRTIAYYMVFAKPSGAGTDVSLNNTAYPGTGEPIMPSYMTITVSGLSPNDAYIFAVAAYDDEDEIIQGIGETSRAVEALNALPVVMCYGYLAQACYDLGMMLQARRAAMEIYNRAVSKEAASRPSWAANPFYRHALRRHVVARWPIPLLHVAVKCILILNDEEEGDQHRDGQLTSDEEVLTTTQIAVLEASRQIAIGIELAVAAEDNESIRLLAFKGYRILLPLLHLESSNALVFAALMTCYQGLLCIPRQLWDTDTNALAARLGFELMRIALENRHLAVTVYNELVKIRWSDPVEHLLSVPNDEITTLREHMALVELGAGVPCGSMQRPSTGKRPPTPAVPPPAAAASAPPGKGEAAPVPIPRVAAEEAGPIPQLDEIIAQAKLGVHDTIRLFESHMSSGSQWIECACKLLNCALQRGEDAIIEEFIPSIKIHDKYGKQFRETLRSLGLEHMLVDPPASSAPPAATAPNTARTGKTPRTDPAKVAELVPELPHSTQDNQADQEPEIGDNDERLYAWCGELCFTEAIIVYRKLVKLQSAHASQVNPGRGPRYNVAFDILRGVQEATEQVSPPPDPQEFGEDTTVQNPDAPVVTSDSDPNILLDRFLEKIALSCRLFFMGRAWQALQAACQYLTNGVWITWNSPMALATTSSRVESLIRCVSTLLDMVEVISSMIKSERDGRVTSTLTQGSTAAAAHTNTLSLATTTLATSAMSVINADQSWIADLVAFSIQALMAAKRWDTMVQIGKKYHFLSGGKRFSEKMLPLLLYAQQQFLTEQETSLSSTRAARDAFVRDFLEQEAKKKKKKSRLVVEEVLSPEEIEFRAKKEVMENEIGLLIAERDRRAGELRELENIHDLLSRTINKAVQAMDTCHDLVERYRRDDKSSGSTLRVQIINAYNQCVVIARQKRQRRLVCQAFQELGDFYWENGDTKMAVKAWHDAIDNAFNALNVVKTWRDSLGIDQDAEKEYTKNVEAQIRADGLWIGLTSCNTLTKLILLASGSDCSQMVEYALLASATFARVLRASMPHPTRRYLFGTYQIASQFWPGRDLLVDGELLDPFPFGLMFVTVPQVLLQYEYAVEAMPLIAGYEAISIRCFEDANHTANARRLRVEALALCGRFSDAFEILACILHGVELSTTVQKASPNEYLSKLAFHDDRAMTDPSNTAAIAWLSTLDTSKLQVDLHVHYQPNLVRLILITVLKLGVTILRHEPAQETSPLRLGLLNASNGILALLQPPSVDDSEASSSPFWELLELSHLQGEVELQQSHIAYLSGQWGQCVSLCDAALKKTSRQAIVSASDSETAWSKMLDFDCNVPFFLFYRESTFKSRCHLQRIMAELAREYFHVVVAQADTAIQAARDNGEDFFIQRIELLRAQALASLGSLHSSLQVLTHLQGSLVASHGTPCLTFVNVLRMASSLRRAQEAEARSRSVENHSLVLLTEAELAMDHLLRRDGWIGVQVDSSTEPRLSQYHPAAPGFIRLKLELAQGLLESSLNKNESVDARSSRILRCLGDGLLALHHVSKPLASIQARLLFLKGVVLKTLLTQSRDTDDPTDLERVVNECAEILTQSIQLSVREGGYDRELVRLALIELVDLFGRKRVVGKEDEHVQAAFHYLSLAGIVQEHIRTLFDTQDIQSGTITNLDKLAPHILEAINQCGGKGEGNGSTVVPTPAPQHAAPSTAKGAAASQSNAATNKQGPQVDPACVINYFLKILRDGRMSVCSSLSQDVALTLHEFLMQHHSTYGKLCCLPELPPVPVADPEIKAGLVCCQWGRDITPALDVIEVDVRKTSTSTVYFTLGTTRIDQTIDDDAAKLRMERFAGAPLLSRRHGLSEQDIHAVRSLISRLRIDMEDEGSLVIDRSVVSGRLIAILRAIQNLLRPSSPQHDQATNAPVNSEMEIVETKSEGGEATDAVLDLYGNVIPVVCSLETVKCLENFFNIRRGVTSTDHMLCYFLRDLFDA